MLRDLWAVSLAVRSIAVLIGFRRAPRQWIVWASFYLTTGIALRAADIFRPGPHVYADLWCFQQIGSTLLLFSLVSKIIHPTETLVQISALAALVAAGLIAESNHWPGLATETVMWGCGTVTLAMGIISVIGAMVEFTVDAAILAGFLILYSALMLASGDYLNSVNLGIAWSSLEIVSFGAWGISSLKHKPQRGAPIT